MSIFQYARFVLAFSFEKYESFEMAIWSSVFAISLPLDQQTQLGTV